MVCHSQSQSSSPSAMEKSPSNSYIAPAIQTEETEMCSERSVFLPRNTSPSEGNEELISKNLSVSVPKIIPMKLDLEKGDCDCDSVNPYAPTTTNQGDCEAEKKSCLRSYAGILLTLASGIVYTVGAVIVKYMKGYHPFTLGVYRLQGIFLPSLFMVLYIQYVKKVPILSKFWPLSDKAIRNRHCWLLLRCTIGTVALILHVFSLQRLDVADVSVINACQPVFVTVAAYIFLGESCGVIPILVALISILGVGIISRPPILTGEEAFNQEILIGTAFAIGTVLALAVVFIILRHLRDVHVVLLTLTFGFWGTIQCLICAVAIGEFKLPQSGKDWALTVALAGVTLLGQVSFTLALQYEQAGPVALVRTSECLFAFFFQFILLGTLPDLYSLIGASIIIVCVILTALRKLLSTLPDGHPKKTRFWFMMK